VRLSLEDRGEGWFWGTASIDVEVLGHVLMHAREFYRVLFPEPIEVPEGEGPESLVGCLAVCTGAWLSPRWVGHEIRRDHSITALLWVLRDVREATEPPSDGQYSARVKCLEVD
jgi:hypothetical protein